MKGKKSKGTKKCVIKRKIRSEQYKHCLRATNPESKIKHLEKLKLDIDTLIKKHKEFIKSNKSILICRINQIICRMFLKI